MDDKLKSYFRAFKCPLPGTESGTLSWTQASLFGGAETAAIEWGPEEMKVYGRMDNHTWSLHLRKPSTVTARGADEDWTIVQSENLQGGTPRAKLWRARDLLEQIRQIAPVPDQGWESVQKQRRGPRP